MSFFHQSRTTQSPITRKLSRKKVPTDHESSSNGNDSSGPSPSATPQNGQVEEEVASPKPYTGEGTMRINESFQPNQQDVEAGMGTYEGGQAQHEINSKEDYQLCKEQVETGHSKDQVMQHFKLVKDLKPLDAPPTMDKELDQTESPKA